MILQLPVEGGHEGGRFKVKYQGKEQVYENHKDSDRCFYVSSFYGNSQHSMESITRGARLTLTFNLIWENAQNIIPKDDFPVYINALKEIKGSLPSWIPNEIAFSKMKCISVENLLYFVLEGKYLENDFSFRRLRGKDQKLAQLLQACGFLDTHLAVVTQTVSTSVNNCDSYCDCGSCDGSDGCESKTVKSSTEISRWVDSKDVSKKLIIDIDWKKQCVGPHRQLPTSDSTATNSENEWDTSTNEEYIHHFILVIWPKHHSFQMYCRYGLDSLLDNIEITISSSRLLKKNRQKATEDLRRIISFCCINPRKVWSQKGSEGGELTLRLLRLCVDLRACEEGLSLLKIISSDFRLPQERVSNTQEIFEGIKTEQVAEAIVELECRVTG